MVGHEQTWGKRRDEDHADNEQDQRHSDVGLRADQISNFLSGYPKFPHCIIIIILSIITDIIIII